MSPSGVPPAGDQATVSICVAVEPAIAFEVFTKETDLWWRRGLRYRLAGRRPKLPSRLVFTWRNANFAAEERTDVEVLFEPTDTGARVTVQHRGWSAIRPDHPARHGLEGAEFSRMIGLWWGGLMTGLRERIETRGTE